MKLKDFLINNIKIGSYPYQFDSFFDASKYDIIINVSDEYNFNVENRLNKEGCKTYWFPMNECKKDIGLNSIFAALTILYQAEKQNKKVYLHCHAGVNRSPTVFSAYFFMRSGKHLIENEGGYINRLVANCNRGYLPSKTEMEQFLVELNNRLNDGKNGGLDKIKIDTINNL
jgi:Dual specificity phosphatase, catalytic domain